jgi:hypothetical protein
MTFLEQCSYKYLLNSASIGYANKFKYVLLCGSVVIYVRDGMTHKEFYEYGLLPGIHYVSVPDAKAVPAMVRWLKKHDSYARAVAMAGRARMASLTVDAVADFMAELLTQYAQKQVFKPMPQPGAVKVACEDDLWRHYARDPYWMAHYLMQDNQTCTRPMSTGRKMEAPGWGGAYTGSKVRCVASHDLRTFAQPDACARRGGRAPHQPGTSFASFDTFPSASFQDNYDWTTSRLKTRDEMEAIRRKASS